MYLIKLIEGVFMGRKKVKEDGGDVISKKEVFEELNEKVVETVEVTMAKTMKVGDSVMHPTFGEGKIVKFSTIGKIIGAFGGTLRTIPLDELETPVSNATAEIEEEADDE